MSKETQDKIIQEANAWRHNRLIYPGWIIAPRKVRERLWTNTEMWINSAASLPQQLNREIKIWLLFEVNWRLETCLMPLFSNLAETVESTIWSFYEQLSASIDNENISPDTFQSPHLREYWIHLAFALVRYYREERQRDNFDRWQDKISNLKSLQNDELARLCYERSLLALAEMDDSAVSLALNAWPNDTSDPIWQLRNAAVHAEIGNVDRAEHEAERVLTSLRSQRALRSEDIPALSREGWAMMLLKVLGLQKRQTEGHDVTISSRGRWDRLSRFECDPRPELEAFHVLLDRPTPTPRPLSTKNIGFHPDEDSVTQHLSGDNSFDKLESGF